MSNEQNATPDRRSVDDQLISIVRLATAAGHYDGADWIKKRATAFVERKIAEVSEPRGLSPYNPSNGRIGGPPESIDGAIDRIERELSGTSPSEPARTDAVKEAIALIDAHPDCKPGTGYCSFRCPAHLRPLLTALVNAERKLADEHEKYYVATMSDAKELRAHNATKRQLEATEKRAKDADERAARWRGEQQFDAKRNADLTRKLATAREAVEAAIKKTEDFATCEEADPSRCREIVVHAAFADFADEIRSILAAIDAPAGEEAERIKCSAIREAGIVYEAPIAFADHDGKSPGAGHWAVSQRFPGKDLLKSHDTGFVTSIGRYVDRKEGAQIALAAGQIKKLHYQPDTLFSEDFNHPDDAPPPEPASAQGSEDKVDGLIAAIENSDLLLSGCGCGGAHCGCSAARNQLREVISAWLKERDDALEGAAVDACTAFECASVKTDCHVWIGRLRSVLAQRAKGKA